MNTYGNISLNSGAPRVNIIFNAIKIAMVPTIGPIELFTNEEHTNARMLKAELNQMQKNHALLNTGSIKTLQVKDDLDEIVIESQKDDV